VQGSAPQKTVVVVAALLRSQSDPKQFLIQQRLPGGPRGDLWEFPGGKIDSLESDEAALKRECLEELATHIEVLNFVTETTHEYSDLTVRLRVYLARIISGAPKALCAQQIRFATFEEMTALPFCEADVPLLKEFPRLLLALESS
jgi:8-oxo-dGTP diphosphatase